MASDAELILDALAGGLSVEKAAKQFRVPADDVRKLLKEEIERFPGRDRSAGAGP